MLRPEHHLLVEELATEVSPLFHVAATDAREESKQQANNQDYWPY